MDWTAIASFVVAGITAVYVVLVYKQLKITQKQFKVMTTQDVAISSSWRIMSGEPQIVEIKITNLSSYGIYNVKVSVAIVWNQQLRCFSSNRNITHVEPHGEAIIRNFLGFSCKNEQKLLQLLEKHKGDNTIGIIYTRYMGLFGLEREVLLKLRTAKTGVGIIDDEIVFLETS